MAISLGKYISENYKLNEEASDVYRLIGKWLAETRSSKYDVSFGFIKKFVMPFYLSEG